MNAVPLIELTDVTKTYRNGPLAVEVLHGLSLRIFPGEFVAIMGTSGSGKSTLMNILGCLDKPTTGEYRFKGEDVSRFDRDQLATLRREAFGFVFQSYHLIAGSTAVENVEVPAIYAGMPPAERHAHAAELLTSLGLGERLHHQPNQLSGGQQQRVSIARALMNGGQIILADEPTGALDTRSGVEVMERLKALSRAGHTVILITHDPDVASQAQRVIEVRDGRILSDPGPVPHDEAPPVVIGRSGAPSFSAQALESAKMALRALRSNVFRSVLTLLGIVIGVGSVIAMLAIGNGAKQEVVDRISGMGSNLLLIRPGAPNTRGNGIVSLVLSDAETLNDMPNVLAAVPENTGGVTARYGNADYQTQVTATSANFPVARNWPVARGTFFAKEDVDEYAAVAVLGQTVADVLFPGVDPIGSHLVLNNVLFQVIGVMAVRGASPMGQDQDDAVVVPITTGNLRLFGQRSLRTLTVAVADTTRIDDTQDAVSTLLQERHGVVDFQIRNMASLIETMSQTQNTLTILLGSIAAISLLVGGIGVMNIMLVSVTERTREIGIRMATGARSHNIQQQFLIEAVVVSAIGGAIGVVGGLATAGIIKLAGTPIQLTLAPVLLAFGCSFATGLVFGWLPARKASALDPVVALSSE